MNADFSALPWWFIPFCTMAAGVFIAAIKMRPANKTADEAIADGQYKRLLAWCDRLERRIEALEAEVETCHRERDAALAEVARRDAINLGQGQVRQMAAEVVAGDRHAEREERKKGEGK